MVEVRAQRASKPDEPDKSRPAGAQRWSDYLDWVRAELIDGVLGLSPEQQRTTLVPSGWTPIELLSHVLHMEQRWFVRGIATSAKAASGVIAANR